MSVLSVIERMYKRSFPIQFTFIYVFLSCGLIINFLQLLSCVIWPFNKSLYRRVNRHLANLFWSNLTWAGQEWSGSECDVYYDPENMSDPIQNINKEHVICIMNHKYDIDWLMGWIICQRTGLLHVCIYL